MSQPIDADLTRSREFLHDLRNSAEVVARNPVLPLLTFVLALGTQAQLLWVLGPHGGFGQLIGLLSTIAMAGWVGTQRIWIQRGFHGQTVGAGELVPLTASFVPRFIVLGIVVTLPTVAFFQLSIVLVHDPRSLLTAWFVVPIVIAVVTDVALTFVAPALAFDTPRVRDAFRIGVRLLRDDWPRCAWYALIPPFALVLVARLVPRSALSATIGGLVAIAAHMLGLWFKGAIAGYYLRRRPVAGNESADF